VCMPIKQILSLYTLNCVEASGLDVFLRLPVLRTLPLSGRQGVLVCDAKSLWWPVHSRGVFEVSADRIWSMQLSVMRHEFTVEARNVPTQP
jgi:hypothetical protein